MNLKKYATIRAILTVKWLVLVVLVLLILFQFVAAPNTTIRLALYKMMLGVIGAIVGHIVVKSLYPYMSLSKMLEEDKLNEMPDAIKFIGACLLRGLVMSAIIVGVLLGV